MLPTMLSLWGVVATLQGVVHNYQGLYACRFFLGLLEGEMGPGFGQVYFWLTLPHREVACSPA